MTTSALLQFNAKQFFSRFRSFNQCSRSMIACLIGNIRYSEFTHEPRPIYEMRATWRHENMRSFHSNTFLSILERCLLRFYATGVTTGDFSHEVSCIFRERTTSSVRIVPLRPSDSDALGVDGPPPGAVSYPIALGSGIAALTIWDMP